jgi:exosortase K
MKTGRFPWLSWGTALLAAYGLKLWYSRASAEDLSWVLVPAGWLRGETLTLNPEAGWTSPDGSYVIAPACAGVNFLIVAFTVAVLGFSHRLRSPGKRLGWWLGSLLGAYVLTLAVNTLRIVAAVELYRVGSIAGLTSEQAHRLLGTVLYLGALWTVFAALDGLTSGRPAGLLVPALLIPGAYLGMTLGVPLLNGNFRQYGARYAEHAMMVSLVALTLLALFFLARRRRWDGQTDDPGCRG